MPWPKEVVASLHFPHLKGIGIPISSISNSILLIKLIFVKNCLNFSTPIFWPILTEPILPYLIKISSAVRSLGIFLSYSLIVFFPQSILFSRSINFVSTSIKFSSSAAANVKVLNTEPSS